MKPLKTLIPLILAFGVSMMAGAEPANPDHASLFKTPFQGQSTTLLQLAQMPSDEDICDSKCSDEYNECLESGKEESECSEANQACEENCGAE
jgi:hypothetical protein